MITYRILPKDKLVIVVHHDKSSTKQVKEFRKTLSSDPEYSPEYDVINDSSKLMKQYTFDEVCSIAEDKTLHPRIAIIAPSDLSFGVGRTWGMLVGNKEIEVNVFREAGAALSWLGKNYKLIEIIEEMKNQVEKAW